MTTTTKSLIQQFTSFIEEASYEELALMERALEGWKGKRCDKYNSYVEAWLQASRRWKDEKTYETVTPNHMGFENKIGITHGGVTATLLDTTMGEMVNEDLLEGQAAVTLEIKINFIKAGKGNQLRCESSYIAQSYKVKVTEGKVYDDEDQLIAHATGTFYVKSNK